jgi:hypothetical protein
MNQFEMVVIIVAIVMFAGVMRSRYSSIGRRKAAEDDPEALRLRDEVKTLKDRIAVLERIATDKESTLEREIERLRDH